jgi:hypothetical protein
VLDPEKRKIQVKNMVSFVILMLIYKLCFFLESITVAQVSTSGGEFSPGNVLDESSK